VNHPRVGAYELPHPARLYAYTRRASELREELGISFSSFSISSAAVGSCRINYLVLTRRLRLIAGAAARTMARIFRSRASIAEHRPQVAPCWARYPVDLAHNFVLADSISRNATGSLPVSIWRPGPSGTRSTADNWAMRWDNMGS